MAKSSQLQIRIAPKDKSLIAAAARRAGLDMSSWVLSMLLPANRTRFERLVFNLSKAKNPRLVWAELNDFISALNASEFDMALGALPQTSLDAYSSNYLAAMVELAAVKKGTAVPAWTAEIPALSQPVFGSCYRSLRVYLLLNSPLPFRRRNIFIDASIGDRV